MKLTEIQLKNFLSIKGRSGFPLDPNVTVLLGANDHGKSNFLRALRCLNSDVPITREDENWDSPGAEVLFIFSLRDSEQDELHKIYVNREAVKNAHLAEMLKKTEEIRQLEEQRVALSTPGVTVTETISGSVKSSVLAQPATQAVALPKVSQDKSTVSLTGSPAALDSVDEQLSFLKNILASPEKVRLSRTGVGGALCLNGIQLAELPEDIGLTCKRMIPRVELFDASSSELHDSVDADQIKLDTYEFLQGIFFYAGLDPLNSETLFTQDDETDKALETASKKLDAELRRIWGQGTDLNLHFQLKHRGASIELQADDPAVANRKTRMSKRSAGVTQFFRLSMALHARTKKNPANSYIFVFDEPGVFLHPKGQKDLIQVFEELAQGTQIIYATHSLFMLNQNYPERHRLVSKDEGGTKVDNKPYRANWKYAVDALGVRLTANILFSPTILLVEGDSDPIYIYELFRTLNQSSQLNADANTLGILSYRDVPNLRFLTQIFRAENEEVPIAIVYDGDSQGKDFAKAIVQIAKRVKAANISLDTGLAIEDYCLYPDQFLAAAVLSIKTALESVQKNISEAWLSEIKPSFEAARQAQEKNQKDTPNIGRWFKDFSFGVVGEEVSKVSLARNYASICRETPSLPRPDAKRLPSSLKLCKDIVSSLSIGGLRAKREV